MSASRTSTAFPWIGLLVLAGAIFSSVTSEFLPTGLLPDMARELKVSVSQVGLLVSIFAGTVVISTTPLAAVTRRFSRKGLVVIVLLTNALAGVLAAIAPNYEVLVGARVLGGLAHGLFWAVVGAYAAHLVPKHQLGRAIAITGGGGTAAFVLGVPLGSALGHAFGWRLAFAAIAVVLVVLAVLVVRYLPAVDHHVTLATGEIAVPVRRDRSLVPVIVVCAIIIVMMLGHNLYYTYIAPWLIAQGGFDESAIAPILFLFGGAGAVGLALGGIVADRFPQRGFLVLSGGVAVPLVALILVPTNHIVVLAAMVVWGVLFGGLPAMLQTRILHVASARVRDLSAALFTTSFNAAIGGGALLGGIALDQLGIQVLPTIDLGLLLAALILAVVTDAWLARRSDHHG